MGNFEIITGIWPHNACGLTGAEIKPCCPLNLSLANNRLPMDLLCEGSQNHSFCPQGAFDPKPSQERTKEPVANSHQQMCVHVCGLLQWRVLLQEAAGFQLTSSGQSQLPLFPRSPLFSVKSKADWHNGRNEAGSPEDWVQVSLALCLWVRFWASLKIIKTADVCGMTCPVLYSVLCFTQCAERSLTPSTMNVAFEQDSSTLVSLTVNTAVETGEWVIHYTCI